MINKNKEVQGLAVYGEFRLNDETRQIIITPDGYTSEGVFVDMKMHRRTVSAKAPRSQWKTNTCPDLNDLMLPKYSPAWAQKRIEMYFGDILNKTALIGWAPVGPALVVEVSRKDMTDISRFATPTKIIYRIQVSRAAAGYPTDLYPAASSV